MFKNLSPPPESFVNAFTKQSFFLFKINKQTIMVRLNRMGMVPNESTTLMGLWGTCLVYSKPCWEQTQCSCRSQCGEKLFQAQAGQWLIEHVVSIRGSTDGISRTVFSSLTSYLLHTLYIINLFPAWDIAVTTFISWYTAIKNNMVYYSTWCHRAVLDDKDYNLKIEYE